MTQEVLTTTEVMEYLKITRPTLFRLLKEGTLKAQKVGHNYRFLKSELEKYLRGETEDLKAAAR